MFETNPKHVQIHKEKETISPHRETHKHTGRLPQTSRTANPHISRITVNQAAFSPSYSESGIAGQYWVWKPFFAPPEPRSEWSRAAIWGNELHHNSIREIQRDISWNKKNTAIWNGRSQNGKKWNCKKKWLQSELDRVMIFEKWRIDKEFLARIHLGNQLSRNL